MKLTAEVVEGFTVSVLQANFDEPVPTPQLHRDMWKMYCSKDPFVAIAAPRG